MALTTCAIIYLYIYYDSVTRPLLAVSGYKNESNVKSN